MRTHIIHYTYAVLQKDDYIANASRFIAEVRSLACNLIYCYDEIFDYAVCGDVRISETCVNHFRCALVFQRKCLYDEITYIPIYPQHPFYFLRFSS